MGNFKIFETDQFLKDIGQSGRPVNNIYAQLKENPYFGKNIKKLANYRYETWRYRLGSWRFFYEINDRENAVYMIAADNCQDISRVSG